MKIDIAMTAALRPEVLQRTLSSLFDKMAHYDGFRLILNIDPIGPGNVNQMIDVANKYFPDNVINIPKRPDHVKAFRWVWENSESDFILFWEDDYILLKEIALTKILFSIMEIKGLATVGFDRKNKSILNYPGYVGVFKQYSENFYERLVGKSLGGPPSIMTKKYVKSMLPFVVGEPDEISAHHGKVKRLMAEWRCFIYTEGIDGLVEDIGKAWLASQGLRRYKHTFGLEWSK